MPQIINQTYFNKENELYLPLAVANPVPSTGQTTSNNVSIINNLCAKVEIDLLLNALGNVLYQELQTALADIDNANAKWKNLVNGENYDDKTWKGLKNDYSFLAYKIHAIFLTENADQLTALGVSKAKSKNNVNTSSNYRIVRSNNLFLKGYQNGYVTEPIVFENGIDWFSQNEIDVSFWTYLIDKKADFPTWNENNFYIFGCDEQVNSFGL
jgi:hypothetical protein